MRRYDEETVHLLKPGLDDCDTYASIVRQRRTRLTQLFEMDRAEFGTDPASGWDAVRATEEESADTGLFQFAVKIGDFRAGGSTDIIRWREPPEMGQSASPARQGPRNPPF